MNTLSALHSTEQVEVVVRGPEPVRAPFSTVGQMLAESAARFPNHPLLIHPRGEGVTVLTHGEAWERARHLADALIEFGLSAERPLAILSGNSIDHALLCLAAQIAGVPMAPISAAYSHLNDLGRLRQVLEILSPGLVLRKMDRLSPLRWNLRCLWVRRLLQPKTAASGRNPLQPSCSNIARQKHPGISSKRAIRQRSCSPLVPPACQRV